MKGFDTNKIPWTPIIYVGGGILAYFTVIKPLLESLGVKDSKEDEDIRASEKLPGWNIMFFDQAVKQKKVTAAELKSAGIPAIYTKIRVSLDKSAWQDDDEETVLAEIRKIRTQAELSFLSALYNNQYKKSLFEHLRSKFSDGEMATVVRYVKDLPLYKPKTISGLPTVW